MLGWHLQLFLSMDRRWQMEVGLTERMFQAKGAGGTKARRQEGKGHVSSGNEGNPIWIEHEGVCVRSAEKGELGCLEEAAVLKALWEDSVLCVSGDVGE